MAAGASEAARQAADPQPGLVRPHRQATIGFVAARLLFFATVVLAVSALVGTTSAQAGGNFYWYGEGNSTCWQKTGEIAAETPQECDSVSEWFLNSSNPVKTLEGAFPGDLGLTQSGDYCNAYNLNEGPLYTRDSGSQEALTGFNPATDTMTEENHADVCQALGSTWGQGLRPKAKATCGPCGMHHYVSFASQKNANGEATLRPWSNAFAGPALVVEGAAYPHVAKAEFVWGYLCPEIEQVGSRNGDILEYCFVEWTKGWGLPPAEGQVLSEFTPHEHDAVELRTDFALGTRFSTEIAGSGNSVYGEHTEPYPFKAAITEGNLLEAIRAANAAHGMGFSENLSEYALIGVEQGTEENNSTAELGEKTEGLKLYTQYGGLKVKPKAATEPATAVQATSAELHGAVNPEGSDTHTYFQYGETTSYGNTMPTPPGWDVGSGMTYVPASGTITGLKPGTPYHYRLVSQNSSGTVYGSDETFNTPVARTNVFFADAKHGDTMTNRWYSGGWFETNFGGGEMAKGTAASGLMEGGAANVFFVNASESDKLADRWMSPTGWSQANFGGHEIAKGTSPFAMWVGAEPSVYFVDATEKDTLSGWGYHEGWKQYPLGGDEIAANTSPSGVMVGSEPNVFFVDAKEKDTITDRWYHEGWKQSHLGKDEVAKGTSPSAAMVGGEQSVFFVDASKGNTLTDLSYNPTQGWHETFSSGHEVAKGTSPFVLMIGSEPNVFFVDAKEKDTLTDWWYHEGWKQSPFGGDEVAAGSSPTALEE